MFCCFLQSENITCSAVPPYSSQADRCQSLPQSQSLPKVVTSHPPATHQPPQASRRRSTTTSNLENWHELLKDGLHHWQVDGVPKCTQKLSVSQICISELPKLCLTKALELRKICDVHPMHPRMELRSSLWQHCLVGKQYVEATTCASSNRQAW